MSQDIEDGNGNGEAAKRRQPEVLLSGKCGVRHRSALLPHRQAEQHRIKARRQGQCLRMDLAGSIAPVQIDSQAYIAWDLAQPKVDVKTALARVAVATIHLSDE